MATLRSSEELARPSRAMRASVRAKSASQRTTSFSFGVRGEEPVTAKETPSRRFVFPWALSPTDRKSTRLNSSHANISYAVFCLKKKKIQSPLHVLQTRRLPRVVNSVEDV